jgi:signal peptidase II
MALGLGVAAIVAIADQLTKFWILRLFAAHEGPTIIAVTPFFNLVLTGNRGVSFGLFNNGAAANMAIFTAVAVLIVVGLLFWLRRVTTLPLKLGIGLVIGGAVGNVADRLMRGAVVDFLDFHLGNWHWFAFNLADAAICLGVAALFLDGLLARRGNA